MSDARDRDGKVLRTGTDQEETQNRPDRRYMETELTRFIWGPLKLRQRRFIRTKSTRDKIRAHNLEEVYTRAGGRRCLPECLFSAASTARDAVLAEVIRLAETSSDYPGRPRGLRGARDVIHCFP